MVQIDHSTARRYWRALVDNASRLVEDADTLLRAGSVGRARSLTVLAEEELGKALAVYETFAAGWSAGETGTRDLPDAAARDHLAKYLAAFEFGRELEHFWGGGYEGDYPEDDDWEGWFAKRRAEARAAAHAANAQKQRGFYVDLDGGTVQTPADLDGGDVAAPLQRAAQVIEMMLITDHTRMQDGPPELFDATHEQQVRLLGVAHPDEFADFIDRVRARQAEADGEQ